MAPFLPTLAVLIGLFGLHDAWLTLLIYHLGIVLVLALDRQPLPSLRRGGSRLLAPVVAVCAASGVVLALGWPVFAGDSSPLAENLAALGLEGNRWVAFAAYYVLVNPVLEELFWRGRLAPGTRRVHWHDAAFAAYHGLVLSFLIEPVWIAVCLLALVGAAWAWRKMVFEWGGLLGPALSHLVADASIIAAAFYLIL